MDGLGPAVADVGLWLFCSWCPLVGGGDWSQASSRLSCGAEAQCVLKLVPGHWETELGTGAPGLFPVYPCMVLGPGASGWQRHVQG